jgi:beta-glucosidase
VEHYERRFGPLHALRQDDLALASRPIDFLGVNYYFPLLVRAEPRNAPLGTEAVTQALPVTAMGWPIDATGLHEVLSRLRRDYGDLTIYITENGAAFDDEPARNGCIDDPERLAYLQGHLAAVGRALAEGVDVRRYFAWSLLDNFEWEHGYAKRFGLVGVDYATQRRVPKRSGLWYRDYIARARGGA